MSEQQQDDTVKSLADLVKIVDSRMERATDPAHLDDLNLVVDELEDLQKAFAKLLDDYSREDEDGHDFVSVEVLRNFNGALPA
jgi:predicted AAA+ superfamily ATPase